MLTEGTYPFVMGGVSTWCDLLVNGIPDVDWTVYALTAGKLDRPAFILPPHVEMAVHVDLWGSGHSGASALPRGRRNRARWPGLAATLLEGLLGWSGDPYATAEALVWCRLHPDRIIPSFRDTQTWDAYLEALARILQEDGPEIGRTPDIDLSRAINLYHTMSWVARVAATPTPPADVCLVTAAGWSGIPAVVDKALHNTPLLLAEHGIYVREAYLASVRSSDSPASRFVSTRLARGLTRLTYAAADLVAPVAEAHRSWEEALGVRPERIRTIPNGVPVPAEPAPAPRTRTVVTVGRIDPLKDVDTLLRVAAAVRRRVPDVTFLHYGPVPRGQETYAAACHRLHEQLRLGPDTDDPEDLGCFRFMGSTSDPTGVVREADVVLMTSISEGFPMSVLEALSQARPVVTTLVGGVLDGMRGAGITAAPGDVHGLADAVTTLLLEPELAERLGRRGHARVIRHFPQERCTGEYRQVLYELAGHPAGPTASSAAGAA